MSAAADSHADAIPLRRSVRLELLIVVVVVLVAVALAQVPPPLE